MLSKLGDVNDLCTDLSYFLPYALPAEISVHYHSVSAICSVPKVISSTVLWSGIHVFMC